MDRKAREWHALMISLSLTSCVVLVWLTTLFAGSGQGGDAVAQEDAANPSSLREWFAARAGDATSFAEHTTSVPMRSVWSLDGIGTSTPEGVPPQAGPEDVATSTATDTESMFTEDVVRSVGLSATATPPEDTPHGL